MAPPIALSLLSVPAIFSAKVTCEKSTAEAIPVDVFTGVAIETAPPLTSHWFSEKVVLIIEVSVRGVSM